MTKKPSLADEIRRITGIYQEQLQTLFKRVDVLDRGLVQLVDLMGDDDEPADAARVSFDKRADNYTPEQNDRLVKYLLAHDHGTPLEMVSYKFRIKAPVVVIWQLVRHRMASVNMISGRYVPFDETEVYLLPDDGWRLQSKDNKQGSSGEFLDAENGYWFNVRRSEIYDKAFELYQDMLDRGVAREQARLVLPFAACYYEFIWKINARSLMNFLKLRDDSHAQSEIQEYARAIKSIVEKTHPRIFGGK